jgi:ERCC4-related helicase
MTRKINNILERLSLDTPKKSSSNIYFVPEPAIIVHREQLKAVTKEEMQVKVQERKSIASATTDEEFQELFTVVSELISRKDFWELLPDHTLNVVQKYIEYELKKRNADDLKVSKKNKTKKEG